MALAASAACTVSVFCVKGTTAIGTVLKVMKAKRLSGRFATKSLSRSRTTLALGSCDMRPAVCRPLVWTVASMLLLRSIRIRTSAPRPVRCTWAPDCPGPASPRTVSAIAPIANARQRKPSARPTRSAGSQARYEKASVSLRLRRSGSSARGSRTSIQGWEKSKRMLSAGAASPHRAAPGTAA